MRFSLRTLILFVSLLAVALTIWRVFFYFPEAHRNTLYEFADGTQQLAAEIGPNTVAIKLVSRNDRDGSIFVEDGKGQTVTAVKPYQEQVLKDCSQWLDVVQIELESGPDLLDIVEVRVFDHETHEVINENHKSFGWRCVRPNLIQIYGLGNRVPSKIDLWLRMESYDAAAVVARLKPEIGASCEVEDGTITLTDMCSGCNMYTPDKGFSLRPPQQHNELAIELGLEGKGEKNRECYYDFRVSNQDGECLNFSSPHYIGFGQQGSYKQSIFLGIEGTEIDHLEFRKFTSWPAGNYEKFYFSAVELPETSTVAFSKPPVANVLVAGKEVVSYVKEFQPLEVKIQTLRGVGYGVATPSRIFLGMELGKDNVEKTESASSLAFTLIGMTCFQNQILLRKSPEGKYLPESAFRLRGGVGGISLDSTRGVRGYDVPIEEIDAIQFTIEPSK